MKKEARVNVIAIDPTMIMPTCGTNDMMADAYEVRSIEVECCGDCGVFEGRHGCTCSMVVGPLLPFPIMSFTALMYASVVQLLCQQ
jgi:hypothetical protein